MDNSFDSWLKEEGIYEEVCDTVQAKGLFVNKLKEQMYKQKISVTALAKKMQTSRTQVHEILDIKNTSHKLSTLIKIAEVLGMRLRVTLVDRN